MPILDPTVDDFVTNFEFYRKEKITPRGWYEVKNGTTLTKWHEVKQSKEPWFRRIFSEKKSDENLHAGAIYTSTPFYSRRRLCRTRVEKMLPTVIIPNLPRDQWYPTKEYFTVPEHITIMKFEADGLMLGRDPNFPLKIQSVSENSSLQNSRAALRFPRPSHIRWADYETGSLISEPSWGSGSAVWTWSSSGASSMERESVTTESEPDIEEYEWIASAVTVEEEINDVPRMEAWDDNDRIWFTLPPSLPAMMEYSHYTWVDRLE